MYNKIFTKILDSSVWLESNPTRIVWFTFLAAMDESGFAQFASVANLAHRARVTLAEAEAAVKCLGAPDGNSSDPDNEGRRIERVPGGWIVLNAEKYRDMVTRAVSQQRTRERVARFRAKKKLGNAHVTPGNGRVTQSEAYTEAGSDTPLDPPRPGELPLDLTSKPQYALKIYDAYPRKQGRKDALRAIEIALRTVPPEKLLDRTQSFASAVGLWPEAEKQYVPHPATWFNRGSYDDDPETWKRQQGASSSGRAGWM